MLTALRAAGGRVLSRDDLARAAGLEGLSVRRVDGVLVRTDSVRRTVPCRPEPRVTDATADRLASLERQVATLQSRLSESAPAPAQTKVADDRAESPIDRRTALRRGTAVLAAGLGGALAMPGQALAADGDPLLLGRPNDATSPTSVQADGARAALVVTNLRTGVVDGAEVAAPALRVTASTALGGLDGSVSSAGDLASSGDLLWYAHTDATNDNPSAVGAVYTSAFANHLEFLSTPRRVLDTRPGGITDENGSPNDRRTRVVAGSFVDNRLRAGTSLVLDLSGLVLGGAGIFANLTVTAPTGPGFLTIYPTPDGTVTTDGRDRPAASALNFGRGQSVANFALVRLGPGSRISIFSTTLAHVLLDLTAVSVFEPFSVSESVSDAGGPRTASIRGKARRRTTALRRH